MDRQGNLKEKTIMGFVWAYGERFVAYAIQMLVSIILARLIAPSQYGIISIVTVMIALADIFVSAGFGSSLVQKKDADELDFNTAFSCGFLISCFLYGILFVSAPFIEEFYKMEELGSVIRVMAVRLPIASINTIQHAKIQKDMEFKKFFFSTLIGTLISAVVGITLALNDFRVWALVAQYLTNAIIDTIILAITDKWHPKFQISIKKAGHILGFGWKVLVQRFIYTFTSNVQSLVIGKRFSAEDLAFYDNGAKIPQAILSNIYDTMGKVIFPAISNIQDEYDKRKYMIRQSVRICTFLLAPVSIALIAMANPIIILLYTDKWLPCVPFLQIYCLRFLPRPLTTIAQQATLAVGRSDLVLSIEIVLNLCLLGTLCIATFVFNSVTLIAWGTLVAVFLGVILNSIILNNIMGYTYKEQLFDTMPSYIVAASVGGVAYAEGLFINNIVILLICQSFTMVILYVLLSLIFNKAQILQAKQLLFKRKQ